jgi:hypothetical protein
MPWAFIPAREELAFFALIWLCRDIRNLQRAPQTRTWVLLGLNVT